LSDASLPYNLPHTVGHLFKVSEGYSKEVIRCNVNKTSHHCLNLTAAGDWASHIFTCPG